MPAVDWIHRVALAHQGNDCLIWPFSVGNHGYGQVRAGGTMRLAHRVLCEAAHGKPPKPKMDAAHRCGNRLCVNPIHIRWASRGENETDKRMHGCDNRGQRHGRSKLSEADVIAIRASDALQRDLALKYGVARQTISDIKTGRRWSWL